MWRCPVASCSIAKHQRWQRLGHQQLRTATGEHPAGMSVRTADVILMACQTNVCSQVRWCSAIQQAIVDRRQLELHTLGRSQPVEIGKCASNVVRVLQASNGSCSSCTGCLVSLPAQNCHSLVGTEQERRQASGRQMSALNVECCAAGTEWRSSWQQISECGIAC